MDHYLLHKLCISPLLSTSPEEEFKTIAKQLHHIGEANLLDFLSYQMLAPLWFETLSKNNSASLFSESFTTTLKQKTMATTARYMAQQHTIKISAEAFQAANIPYAVFKGANTREHIYDNPAVRPSDDIDILVSKTDKIKAIQTLVKTGFAFHPKPISISHEATLIKNDVKIDLHWNILRPGRTRLDLSSFSQPVNKLISLVFPISTLSFSFISFNEFPGSISIA